MAIRYFAPLMLDDYKLRHHEQYPKDTTEVYSNMTARSGKLSNIPNSKGIIFFGLQLFIIDYLIEDWDNHFFNRSEEAAINAYAKHSGMSIESLEHIRQLHKLGYLPLEIKALPEGSYVPYGIPFITIKNTHPDFAWLTNSIESVLSTELWPMIAAITTTAEYLKVFNKYADITGSSKEVVPYQAHNFAFRGMGFREAAVKSGLAHLAAGAKGTDTTYASALAREYYSTSYMNDTKIGSSIPATEHSVMCAGGREGELDTIARLLTEVHPTGPVSIVMDTWDFFKLVAEGLPKIKDIIMNREGVLVIRPDSGDPAKILCGDITSSDSNEAKGLIELLWDIFGGTINEKGYKVLDSHLRAIYGDSITLDRQDKILAGLAAKGFASENVFLGIGSYSYQYVTRDTHGIAVKSTAVIRGGFHIPIYKDPKTDGGTKKSASGYLMVTNGINGYGLEQNVSYKAEARGCLETVFSDGFLTKRWDIQDIIARVSKEYR